MVRHLILDVNYSGIWETFVKRLSVYTYAAVCKYWNIFAPSIILYLTKRSWRLPVGISKVAITDKDYGRFFLYEIIKSIKLSLQSQTSCYWRWLTFSKIKLKEVVIFFLLRITKRRLRCQLIESCNQFFGRRNLSALRNLQVLVYFFSLNFYFGIPLLLWS